MTQRVYLAVGEVLAMHAQLLARYGGSEGVRDAGALESALYRPQTGYYRDIIEEAAALWESLAGNHPFVDGNKRVAFAAVDVFLRVNGFRIRGTSEAIYRDIIGMHESGTFDFEHIEPWLRAHVRPDD
ncbi:MAG: type II toxin-antitoxin system death-on-curing family toxin [Xanthomonadales bacterium]|nr:type II toxin-antitoxin system death-on-curing family toxin [Xanthomonadales bacterium]